MAAPRTPLIDYRIAWKPSGTAPGQRPGRLAGAGDRLRALVLLRDSPDPRRIDLRASLRDPLERLWVRDFNQNSAIRVVVMADHSASMGYHGRVDRQQVVRELAGQLALSAWRAGDAFGFHAAGEALVHGLQLPARVNRGAFEWVNRRMAGSLPGGHHARGLFDALALLPRRRALVLLVSDFRWPAGQLAGLLARMDAHDVVPVMLEDSAEAEAAPRSGIATLRDRESGARRFVWISAQLHQRLAGVRRERIERVRAECRARSRGLFLLRDDFDPAALSAHFHSAARRR